jgi:DNA-binding winged helix-turn-helix (wHTH) protein
MTIQEDKIYEFHPFTLYPRERLLRRDGEVVPLQAKAFDLLCVLVENAGSLVEKDELMKLLWSDAAVEEGNLTLNISLVRKALGDDTSPRKYIETVPRFGYRFIAPVNVVYNRESELATKTLPGKEEHSSVPDAMIGSLKSKENKSQRHNKLIWGASIALITVMLLIAAFVIISKWRRNIEANKNNSTVKEERTEISSPVDEVRVKAVVQESQFFETLTLYTNPKAFDSSQLNKYWVPAEQDGKEAKQVESSIQRLVSRGWHYGKESKAMLFEFRYAKIYAPGDQAVVGTLERWYLPVYKEDGTRVLDHNVYLGPIMPDYILRKINNEWLIQETSVPRPQDNKN